MAIEYNHDHENEITLFAETNFRNQRRRFGIKTDDRRRHMYIIGKTGMGKTVLQENMVMSDVMAGHGVCYIDPHGDTAEKLLDYIPSNRINDVVYFNPADLEFPVGFNILESVAESQKHLVASGLMGVFKKIWPDVWSPRMEYILLNCVHALLDYPGATLLGINRLLVDDDYRARVVAKIRDPIIKTFWVAEFASWTDKYKAEALPAIQNKVGQFLSASVIRNIVSQVKSTIDIRKIMDDGKILIVNLSKGRIGEENMRLLGGMIISRMQMAAMERVDMLEEDRRDFYLFVDEFQNFANESFASILSEARKYHLSLTIAHQYIEQLTEEVRAAVIGNVGTIVSFRVGSTDAEFLEKEFLPVFTSEDLVNLPKFTIYLKLMVDGVATSPFSATTLPPMARLTGNEEKVIAVSRERYAIPRAQIAEKVLRWSGMESATLRAAGAETADEEAAQTESVPKISVDAQTLKSEPETPKHGISDLESEGWEEDDEGPEEYLKISPERLAAITKVQAGAGKKEKPKYPHTCSRCGKKWDMPIQLDPTRPMYCADCMPIVREEQKNKSKIRKQGPGPEDKEQSTESPLPKKPKKNFEPNRPRIVGKFDLPPISEIDKHTEIVSDRKESGLIADIEKNKGKKFETRKRHVERRLDPRGSASSDSGSRQSRPHDSAPSQKEKDFFARIEDDFQEELPQESKPVPTLTVFKKKTLPTASINYPAATGRREPNPLDKRQSMGIRSDASAQQPRSDKPQTLMPGQKVSF
ncbi:MAG: type IV secretory system conjugative DNA transfer family protein [Patescibacteria group bacterium]